MSFLPITVGEARGAARKLLHRLSTIAQLEADILLAQILAVERPFLDLLTESPLSLDQQTKFNHLLSRRISEEPLAYITRKKEFWSLEFEIDESTLVPRPETELVVERALHQCRGIERPVIADLGTGCGTIALALASEMKEAKIYATDLSAAALLMAEKNRQSFDFENVHFYEGDWTSPLPDQKFDVIVSNPPYIAIDDPCLQEKVMSYEPKLALVGGENGLTAIRTVIGEARQYLKSKAWLILEHGFDQSEPVHALLKEFGFNQIKTFRDLAGLDRVTESRVN